ncbi:MAG: fatty acid desaturase [Myxococcota bacterium]|nr:fatty acid desaturase [Myxococcota bacterium]
MDTAKRNREILWLNVAFLTLTPLAALILTPLYIAHHGVLQAEIWACIGLWFLTGLGITAGYHRLFSHRSYKASWPVRLGFAIVGAGACQNSIIAWASDHRTHHRHVDTETDPYDANRGFWFSHIGWIFLGGRRDTSYPNVPDLWADPICRWQHRYYWPIAITFNLAVPLALGFWSGRVGGMLLFAGLLRIVLVHHFTFTINSLAHMWGSRPWSDENTARDNWFLSLLSFGEGYHNFHHAYQHDYRNGPKWYNYDPSKWLIWSLSHSSLVWDIKRTPDESLIRSRSRFAKERMLRKLAERPGRSLEDWAATFRDGHRILTIELEDENDLQQKNGVLSTRIALLRGYLLNHVEVAENALESALKELKKRRTALTAKLRNANRLPKAEHTAAIRRDLDELKRSFRMARRQAQVALRDLVRTYQSCQSSL